MKYDTQTPYLASYLIVRKDNLIAFVLRSNTAWMNGYYGLPSGKVEQNETFIECAVREAKEEIDITVDPIQLNLVHISHRHEKSDWVDVYFEVKNFHGEVINAEPHMHSELAWLDPLNLPENVIPAVQYTLEQISTNKIYSEFGWVS